MQKNKEECIYKDDMSKLLEKMKTLDIFVFATPVYFYKMTAQLKTLFDQSYARLEELENKEVYYILAGTADNESYFETALESLRGFSICLPNVT